MDRKRGEQVNWYTVPFAERQRMMHVHGMIGRRYADQVRQIISGSIGMDDWEWGVDLFADDPVIFKKLIYEMRFDEVSAVYALFGQFFLGVRLPVDGLVGGWRESCKSLRRMESVAMKKKSEPKNDCPECGHEFRSKGFDGIDAHLRAKHENLMPYRTAWPLIKSGNFRRQTGSIENFICSLEQRGGVSPRAAQFTVGCVADSMTTTSTWARADFSLRPSCSSSAVKRPG